MSVISVSNVIPRSSNFLILLLSPRINLTTPVVLMGTQTVLMQQENCM